MSKVIEATCVDGKVSVAGNVIDSVEILTAGVGESSGLLIIDADKAYYLTVNTPDLKTTVEKVIELIEDLASAITKTADTLTAIGTGMTGSTTAPPAALPGNVTFINNKVTELNATKNDLIALKDGLT